MIILTDAETLDRLADLLADKVAKRLNDQSQRVLVSREDAHPAHWLRGFAPLTVWPAVARGRKTSSPASAFGVTVPSNSNPSSEARACCSIRAAALAAISKR